LYYGPTGRILYSLRIATSSATVGVNSYPYFTMKSPAKLLLEAILNIKDCFADSKFRPHSEETSWAKCKVIDLHLRTDANQKSQVDVLKYLHRAFHDKPTRGALAVLEETKDKDDTVVRLLFGLHQYIAPFDEDDELNEKYYAILDDVTDGEMDIVEVTADDVAICGEAVRVLNQETHLEAYSYHTCKLLKPGLQ